MRYEEIKMRSRKFFFGRGQEPKPGSRVIHSCFTFSLLWVSASFPVVNIGKLYTSYSQVVDKSVDNLVDNLGGYMNIAKEMKDCFLDMHLCFHKLKGGV